MAIKDESKVPINSTIYRYQYNKILKTAEKNNSDVSKILRYIIDNYYDNGGE